MLPRLAFWTVSVCALMAASARRADAFVVDQADVAIEYRIEQLTDSTRDLSKRFAPQELSVLEKLNRADVKHLSRLTQLIVPLSWRDEAAYSPFPTDYPAALATPQLLIVDQPSQVFAAYEFGKLVRWGPVSSGRQAKPTPSGAFNLNWRARTRSSTLSGEWRLNWYFNFHNMRGLAFHEFELPGVPASHACVRLLARDAMWVYNWGTSWTVDAKGQLTTPGTQVIILGAYQFSAAPPWQALDYWKRPLVLPTALTSLP